MTGGRPHLYKPEDQQVIPSLARAGFPHKVAAAPDGNGRPPLCDVRFVLIGRIACGNCGNCGNFPFTRRRLKRRLA